MKSRNTSWVARCRELPFRTARPSVTSRRRFLATIRIVRYRRNLLAFGGKAGRHGGDRVADHGVP
jgi:hypothetical protein